MSFKTTKSLTDFPNDLLDTEKFFLEHQASEIETMLESIEIQENGSVDFYHEDEPSSGEKTVFDGLVNAHDGQPVSKFVYHVPSKILEGEVEITEDQDWQTIGGTVTTLSAFVKDASKGWGRIVGQVKASGNGGQVRVVRASDEASLMAAPYAVSDTEGAWANCQCWANQNQPADTDAFVVQARKNGAISLRIRWVSMSLLEKVS